ncbi:MAG: excinuclease ABC subunit UvrA [Deltaproteobacteria bacterium]|nr:excinuclease ABC subunit UvrA [Deltaproteobacteria bacterium]
MEKYAGEKALVGFTIKTADKGRADIERILIELLKRGFVRIKLKDGVFDISGAVPAGIEGMTEIPVVVDRLMLKPADKARLVESIEAAYREGEGCAWFEVPGRETIKLTRDARCVHCAAGIEKPAPLLFSFNHPVGACAQCKGFGNILNYDEKKIVPEESLTLREGAIEPWTKPSYTWWYEGLERHAEKYSIDLDRIYSELTKKEKKLLFKGAGDFEGIDGFFEYLETKKYKLHIRVFLSRYKGHFTCPACKGTRLKKKSLCVKVGGLNIAEVSAMTITECKGFFDALHLTPVRREIAKEPLKQIRLKLDFLTSTGLGYITLDRLTRTLSGGEAQRIALANQLASALSGVLYILDEPSIGLHPRDIGSLIEEIKKLSSRGNTVVAVEHDPAIIMSADYIVELGPGSGEMGGRLVYCGPAKNFLEAGSTLTSQYLTGKKRINVPMWRRKGKERLTLKGAKGNNLKDVLFNIPLRTFVCVTGVSGSGKSSLVTDTLYRAVAPRFGLKTSCPLPYDSIEGVEFINAVRLVDQEPIGKTPRSNPITYIGCFDDIRHFFAQLKPAVSSSITAGNFSFNVPGGRCETCKGEGVTRLEMYFLPDVYITCGGCNGRRYKPRILEITHHGKNIHDVLGMTFDEASGFFHGIAHLAKKISVLREVGLGYLRLGQSATTLSGGEAQRLKIARELTEHRVPCLYILDEPTTGLHPDDIRKLLSVLGRLVDNGSTVIVVEHNLDCIKTADYVVDLGPEGGDGGGRVIAAGPPEKIAKTRESHTGRYLKEVLSAST